MNLSCNGRTHRGPNDIPRLFYPDRHCCPEYGTNLYCCACTAPTDNIDRHKLIDCSEWNALNRLNKSYYRQFNAGMAPPGQTEAKRLSGEKYRLIRDAFGLYPHIIMA